MKPLEKIFWEETAEMLHVEGMLSKSLQKMHASAHAEPFKQLLVTYRTTVEEHLARVGETLRLFEMPVREKKSDGMMAVLLKGQQAMQRMGSGPVLDSVLLALCRKIIALKLSTYGSLAAWAKLLNDTEHNPVGTFENLLRTETGFDAQFKKLSAKCDIQAAEQEVESVRKSAPKKVKELVEAPHWGSW